MAFPREAVARLLADCHRRCCICHQFCGVKIETDHILPLEEGGTDGIENAIPVCFECHAEIHSYNDKHPRGRKFTRDELLAHKKQWLKTCRERPEALINASRDVEVGPLQALLDELEFNQAVAMNSIGDTGCLFQQAQFLRAIHQGSIAILKDDVRTSVITAYRLIGAANTVIAAAWNQSVGIGMVTAQHSARNRINDVKAPIDDAKNKLLQFLGHAP